MAPLIASLQPTMALCSDLTRTRETAALLGYPDATQDKRLREIDVGEWSGRPLAELVAEDAAAFRGWRAGTHTPPGGESWAAFRARAASAVTEPRITSASPGPPSRVESPNDIVACACGSVSINSTREPRCARAAATLTLVVVFPQPPLRFANTMRRFTLLLQPQWYSERSA